MIPTSSAQGRPKGPPEVAQGTPKRPQKEEKPKPAIPPQSDEGTCDEVRSLRTEKKRKKSRPKGRSFTDEVVPIWNRTHARTMRPQLFVVKLGTKKRAKTKSRKKAMVIFDEFKEALYGMAT